MRYSPDYHVDLEKRYPKVAKSFDQLAAECSQAGPLGKKTQHLIKLGVAIGAGIEGDIQNLATRALEDGATPDEVKHAVILSLTTAGYPAMIVAMQLVEDSLSGYKPK